MKIGQFSRPPSPPPPPLIHLCPKFFHSDHLGRPISNKLSANTRYTHRSTPASSPLAESRVFSYIWTLSFAFCPFRSVDFFFSNVCILIYVLEKCSFLPLPLVRQVPRPTKISFCTGIILGFCPLFDITLKNTSRWHRLGLITWTCFHVSAVIFEKFELEFSEMCPVHIWIR